MRRKLLPLILGGALSIAAVAPAAASNHDDPNCTVQNAGMGGAAALIALVNANLVLPIGANACDIDVLNNSLNNLLRNADIDVLSNILNNSLNNFDINVGPTANGIQVSVLTLGSPQVQVTEIDFDLTQ